MLTPPRGLALRFLVALLLLAGVGRSAMARQDALDAGGLVINEVDYVQPDGKELGEFVELKNVGDAAVSLTRHALATVDDKGAEIRRIELPAVTLQPGDYFVVCGQGGGAVNCDFAIDGTDFLPGKGDGSAAYALALIQPGVGDFPAVLLDSVSYEGSVPDGPFPWTEGAGVSPADVGVPETAEGYFGISRLPDGEDTDKNSVDFSGRCATPGRGNETDVKGCPRPAAIPGLVVNEVDLDQRDADTQEFVELRNGGERPVDLSRYAVLGVDAGSDIYREVRLPARWLAPGDYYVICPASGLVPNCDLAIQPTTELWHGIDPDQLPAAIAIVRYSDIDVDLHLLVDSLSYGTTVLGGPPTGGAWTEGKAASPADNLGQVNVGLSRTPDGVDTDENNDDFKLRCTTPGAANGNGVTGCLQPNQDPSLVVNEADYLLPGPDTEEFVELKNKGRAPVDLAEYVLVGVDGQGVEYLRLRLSPRVLPAGQYHVVCNNGGNLLNCDQPGLNELDALRDRDSGQPVGALAVLHDPTTDPRDDILVDSLAYEGAVGGGPPTGGTWTEGTFSNALDPSNADNVSLARIADGLDTQSNRNDFKQGCVTPGYVNISRPQPGGTCPAPVQVTETPTPGRGPSATPTVGPPTDTATPTGTPRIGVTPSASPTATGIGPTATGTDPATEPPTTTPDPLETPGAERRIEVNSAGSGPDTRPGDGQCLDAGRLCTLQAALEEVNADKRGDPIRITFRPGLGEIRLASANALPPLARSMVTLDGRGPAALRSSAARWPVRPAQTAPGCAAAQRLTGVDGGTGLGIAADGATVIGMAIAGFDVGVEVTGGAAEARIGSDGDGDGDAAECNALWDHRVAQVRLAGSRRAWVSGNHVGIDPAGEPGQLSRTGVGIMITGSATGSIIGRDATRVMGEGRGNRVQNLAIGIQIGGRGTDGHLVSGNLIGAPVASRWERYANVTGIHLHTLSRANQIGTLPVDGEPPNDNTITYNLRDGVVIERGVTETSLHGNLIAANRRDGVRLGLTAAGGNNLRTNSLTANGGAAIAVEALGPELAPPTIAWVDPLRGQAGGQTCPGCVVELFADPLDEARLPLGRTTALPSGEWTVAGINIVKLKDAVLTADTTGTNLNTSRLSDPRPLTTPWRVIEIPHASPRALKAGLPTFERRYRLVDQRGRGQALAFVRFSPLGLIFVTDRRGEFTVEIPLQELLKVGTRVMSFTVEAVDLNGTIHPVLWYPRLVLGWAQPAGPGEAIVDLSSLLPNGLGAVLRRARTVSAELTASGDRPAQEVTDSYGAAYGASPAAELREGQFAWQMNLAQGGGIYELHPVGGALEGILEVTAPVAAFNTGAAFNGDKRAAACTGASQGATIAGWRGDAGCWMPVTGSSVTPPQEGAGSFKSSVPVSVSASLLLADRDRTLRSLQATGVITLYTVGHDLTPPVVNWRVFANARLRRFPATLAVIEDGHAGVDGSGVRLRIGGQTIPTEYDPQTRVLSVPEPSRDFPVGMTGPAVLEVEAIDGFCNGTTVTHPIIIDPDAGRIIYTPYLAQSHRIK